VRIRFDSIRYIHVCVCVCVCVCVHLLVQVINSKLKSSSLFVHMAHFICLYTLRMIFRMYCTFSAFPNRVNRMDVIAERCVYCGVETQFFIRRLPEIQANVLPWLVLTSRIATLV